MWSLAMRQKLTLSIDEAVYEGYRAMAADGEREAEAREWNNSLGVCLKV
jgi:hypothetical protein